MSYDNLLLFKDAANLAREKIDPANVANKKYIGLEHIESDSLSLSGYGYAEDVASSKAVFKKGDILFGKLRPYFRKVVIAPFDGVCSTDIWVVRANENVDQTFLYYWMASKEFVDNAARGSEGTKMPRAKWDYVGRSESPITNKNEQIAIGQVLKPIDDKIENNRRMNETLEEMARAIFQSWFIDFDPVRAKMEGRPTGLSDDISKLFPDSFGDDGLPMDWEITTIEGNGHIITGKTPSTKRTEYFGNDYPFIKIPNMNSVWVTETEISLSELGHQTQAKKLLPKGTVLVSCIASPGEVSIVSKPSHINQQINAVIPNKDCPTSWLYCALVNLKTEIIAMASGGSVAPNLNKGDFSKIKIVSCPSKIMASFDEIVGHLLDKILSNDKENKILAELRDTLLPKLISGELRVKDAEREVEDAL